MISRKSGRPDQATAAVKVDPAGAPTFRRKRLAKAGRPANGDDMGPKKTRVAIPHPSPGPPVHLAQWKFPHQLPKAGGDDEESSATKPEMTKAMATATP